MLKIAKLPPPADDDSDEPAHSAADEKPEGPAKPGGARSGGPTRTQINFWVDVVMLVVFLGLLYVSAVVQFVFPPGVSAAGWTLWGITYTGYRWLQFVLLSVFTLIVLLHVMLHWSWVCGVIAGWLSKEEAVNLRKDDGIQTIYGVGFMVVLLGVLAIGMGAATLMIHSP